MPALDADAVNQIRVDEKCAKLPSRRVEQELTILFDLGPAAILIVKMSPLLVVIEFPVAGTTLLQRALQPAFQHFYPGNVKGITYGNHTGPPELFDLAWLE